MIEFHRMEEVRQRRPLIHCVSNIVTAGDCANLALSLIHICRLELAAGIHVGHPTLPLDGLDDSIDAHGLQLLHQHRGGVHVGLVVGGDGNGHVEAVWIAGLGQQLHSLVRVVGVVIGQAVVKILGEGRVHAGADQGAVTVKGQVQNLLPVHGVAQGLTNQLVVEGLRGIVQIQGCLLYTSVLGRMWTAKIRLGEAPISRTLFT